MGVSTSQLTLNLEPSLVERWGTLREFVGHRVDIQQKPQKTIAADMDYSPSTLTKKLKQDGGDGYKFTCDDLEAYIASTGDLQSVLEYLATKFDPGGDKARKIRTLARLESLASTLEREIAAMKQEAA